MRHTLYIFALDNYINDWLKSYGLSYPQLFTKFIDEQVISDYDGFAEIDETMQTMAQGINDISITVDESARGVADVAENAVDLVNAMSLIKEESESNETIAKSLNGEVSRFKQV